MKEKNTCSIAGCRRSVHARGWCNAHYLRHRKYGDPEAGGPAHYHDPDEAFAARTVTDEVTGCVEWTAAKRNGYGTMRFGDKTILAHRFAWERAHGSIPSGAHVLHRCDNPSCCNVDHLFIGDHQTNMDDMRAKGRGRTPPPRRGADNNQTKITPRDARRIFHDRHTPYSKLAKDHGISKGAVQSIKDGRSWVWVTGATK